jgi:hypothetical protein
MSDQSIEDPEVPPGAQVIDGWKMTQFGRARSLGWDSIYMGFPDENGDQGNTVRITALQAATGRVDMFGIEIDVAGSFSTDEAGMVAASIRSAIDQIEQFEDARERARPTPRPPTSGRITPD